jgi:hypothetical protein
MPLQLCLTLLPWLNNKRVSAVSFSLEQTTGGEGEEKGPVSGLCFFATGLRFSAICHVLDLETLFHILLKSSTFKQEKQY